MSLLGQSLKQYPGLPYYLQDMYSWLHDTEPIWGYITTGQHILPSPMPLPACGRPYHEVYEAMILCGSQSKRILRSSLRQMWANHEPRVNEDASQFNAASIDHARGHFKAWKIEQGKADDFPGYRLSVMIDEDCFQTLQNAPLSENLTTRLEDRLLHYVKISEGLEEEHEPPFPGWMTCSLPQMYPWMISGGI
ncbi:uncharacterized protein N7506_011870 [Penicillium brevicompactum]|uniref:uncharacterized protein n=1 Tax=Penicillium brevicompactum TaxID=5074 RepID=UPI0025417F07|nr:uncharacterized protein N7506_011870 [Penicillium brevicompactum]KAJ5319166.1 hypothetical protein N7506_011870 [Penicillium brevicompactum]